jgi:predicted CopG family antitoxin
VVDRLRSLRGPGESFSDVILRLARSGEPRQVKSRSCDAPVTAT